MSPDLLDRFRGCLLGQAVGDGVGAPYEGWTSENIFWGFGEVGTLIEKWTEKLTYTDDTQMMIGVAEALIEKERIEESTLCSAFVQNYDPERCYGQGARLVLEAMRDGEDWQTLRRTHLPGGSLGNGAAMRAAPIGLLFHADLDRVMEQAKLSALPTHVHPLGIEGAQIFALAVALVVRGEELDRRDFFKTLHRHASSEEFRWAIQAASRLKRGDTVSFLGNSLEAHRSVVTAIACFALSPKSYVGAIERAVGLGNDTDTLAAMAGALSGAYLGVEGIPSHLLNLLEDEEKGRSYLAGLAEKLSSMVKRD